MPRFLGGLGRFQFQVLCLQSKGALPSPQAPPFYCKIKGIQNILRQNYPRREGAGIVQAPLYRTACLKGGEESCSVPRVTLKKSFCVSQSHTTIAEDKGELQASEDLAAAAGQTGIKRRPFHRSAEICVRNRRWKILLFSGRTVFFSLDRAFIFTPGPGKGNEFQSVQKENEGGFARGPGPEVLEILLCLGPWHGW